MVESEGLKMKRYEVDYGLTLKDRERINFDDLDEAKEYADRNVSIQIMTLESMITIMLALYVLENGRVQTMA